MNHQTKYDKTIRILTLIIILFNIPPILNFYRQLNNATINLTQELHKEDDAKVETKTVTVTNVSLKEISRHLFKEDKSYGVIIQTEEYKEPIFVSDIGEALKVKAEDKVELSAIFEPDTVRYVQDVKIITDN